MDHKNKASESIHLDKFCQESIHLDKESMHLDKNKKDKPEARNATGMYRLLVLTLKFTDLYQEPRSST